MGEIHVIVRVTEIGQLEVELPIDMKPGPVLVSLTRIDPDQLWFWSPEWQAQEKKTDEDIAAGRYKTFQTMEDFIVDLFGD
jgi:hypothetical protein